MHAFVAAATGTALTGARAASGNGSAFLSLLSSSPSLPPCAACGVAPRRQLGNGGSGAARCLASQRQRQPVRAVAATRRRLAMRVQAPRGIAASDDSGGDGASDKAAVTRYFNAQGFERWRRIYSDTAEVNRVQLDIRRGHAETMRKVLAWVDNDDDGRPGDADGRAARGETFCDAGCGCGSLAIPLAERAHVAHVAAFDISRAMVDEARRRAAERLAPAQLARMQFSTADVETFAAPDDDERERPRAPPRRRYDTVCCIDVMIHYASVDGIVHRLCALADQRIILSFAPRTLYYVALKKIGDAFPGPSKATRAYLHPEREVRAALERCGWRVRREEKTASRFYFSTLFEAVPAAAEEEEEEKEE